MILRRAMTLLATLVAAVPATVLIGISISPGTAAACSCMMHTDESAYVDADVVFVGTLTEIVPPEPEADGSWRSDALERFVFEVDAVHKGEATQRQVIATAADGASCGLELSLGGPYVVFARTPSDPATRDGELSSGLCSGSRALGAGPLPVGFGEGRPPAPVDVPATTEPAATDPTATDPAATGPTDRPTADTDPVDADPVDADTSPVDPDHDDGADPLGLLAVLAGSLVIGAGALVLASRSSLRSRR